MERKTKYLIITLCCIIGIVLGSTTAWYTWTSSENTDVTFTIGGVTVNYEAGDHITKNLRPTSNKESTAHAIQKEITVSSNKKALFDLYIKAETLPEILSHESFRWEIYEGETLLNRGSFVGLEVGESITVLDQIEINNTVRTLKLYIWIDGVNYDNPEGMGNQNYSLLLSASATDEGTNIYKDPSGANTPKLMSGMVPVEYLTTTDGVEEDGWYVADETTEWYNYSNKEWANAVLVTDESGLREAEAGTQVLEEDVLAYYVWIPRYSYELFNAKKVIPECGYLDGVNYSCVEKSLYDSYNAQDTGIHINFESGTHTTGVTDCMISSIGEETCINAENGNYYTHPAFWWDSNDNGIRETSEELTGIWVGKFEISSETPEAEYGGGSSTTLSVRVKPYVYPWLKNNISNYFTVIQNMMDEDNEYGINNSETDSHMMKNIEWGVTAYLAHSEYGRCTNNTCTSVEVNGYEGDYYEDEFEYEPVPIMTGGTGDGYVSNVGQSTTGNVTGIYDMAGGSNEYVMGNMIYSDGENMIVDSSGFKGMLLNRKYQNGEWQENWIMNTNGSEYPSRRYYDVYSYSSFVDNTHRNNYLLAHLGDATLETMNIYVAGGSYGAWEGDVNTPILATITYTDPFFTRSGSGLGSEALGTTAGLFGANTNYNYHSTRSVLVAVS